MATTTTTPTTTTATQASDGIPYFTTTTSFTIVTTTTQAVTAIVNGDQPTQSAGVSSTGSSNPAQSAATTPGTNLSGSTHVTSGSQCKGKVSASATAGAAIGAAIGGALIAVLITWLFLRSKNGRRNSQQYQRRRGSEKDLAVVSAIELPTKSTGLSSNWESHLPQSADDSSLRLSMKTLFHQIELHVENFYSDTNGGRPITEAAQASIQQFDSSDLPASAPILMQQSSAPTAVMKHCLMKHIVSNISLDEMGQSSFLPMECTALPLARARGGFVDKPGSKEAYAKWRVLTAYLRPDSTSHPDAEADYIAARDSAIRISATAFSAAFEPWVVRKQSDTDRIHNLTEIMRNAAQVGIQIFGQASEFKYIWTPGSDDRSASRARNHRSIVVTPGFVKVTDERSRALDRGQVITTPTVAEL